MGANEEADLDALLILLHDERSGGEFGNWNSAIVGWARARLKDRTDVAIKRVIASLKAPTSPDA